MVISEVGRSGVAWLIAGYGTAIGSFAIGTGSAAVSINNTGLTAESDRNAITGSANISTLKEILWQGDFNTVEMSGTALTEFGMFNTSSGGKLWQREGFGAVTFDGTNELRLEVRWRVL